ncbi:hypothetical protein C0J52_02994 [Blattella germanica]|nr:hypothetical protein C0J52_02994 [Blattella germanica]
MAKLVDFITVPQARASILWLLGEYSDRVPKIAPDEDIVKLQILNLAVKLYLTNPKQTKLLCQYVFSLARYDQNYDIRDRARFLRQFIFPTAGLENSKLAKHAKKIFLATKPAPVLESRFKDREQFQLGSLSHYINSRANGYHDLPPFPEVAPDPCVRDVEPIAPPPEMRTKKQHAVKKHSFYSESEHSSPADEDSDDDSSEEDSSDDDEDSSEEEEDSSQEESESETDKHVNAKVKKTETKKVTKESSEESESEEDSSEDDDEDDEEEEEEEEEEDGERSESSEEEKKTKKKSSETPAAKPKSNLDLLLELDDVPPTMTPVLTPSLGGFLTPVANPVMPVTVASVQPASPSFIPLKTTELLNKISGRGLTVSSRFTQPAVWNESARFCSDLSSACEYDSPWHNWRGLQRLDAACKLRGMNEHSAVVSLPSFAGQTLSSKSIVLVAVKLLEGDQVNVIINCEKMVVGSMILNEIKTHLRS